MQILTSIDFSRADVSDGFDVRLFPCPLPSRDDRPSVDDSRQLKYYSPPRARASSAVELSPWNTRSGNQRRLGVSSIEITRGHREHNKKDEIPEPHTVSPDHRPRGRYLPEIPWSLSCPLLARSPSPFSFSSPTLITSKDLHFYCHSGRLKTRRYRHIVLLIISTRLFSSPVRRPRYKRTGPRARLRAATALIRPGDDGYNSTFTFVEISIMPAYVPVEHLNIQILSESIPPERRKQEKKKGKGKNILRSERNSSRVFGSKRRII